jgi:hypothetical protein
VDGEEYLMFGSIRSHLLTVLVLPLMIVCGTRSSTANGLLFQKQQGASQSKVGNAREAGPADFDEAYSAADEMRREIGRLRATVSAAKTKQAAEQAGRRLSEHLRETVQMLKRALALANAQTDTHRLHRARFMLAYVLYVDARYLESVVAAEFVGHHATELDSKMAMDASFLAMASYLQAYNTADEAHRPFVLSRVANVVGHLTITWPDQPRAAQARLKLAELYSRADRPHEAAELFEAVPADSPGFTTARISAGRMYWAAYLKTLRGEADAKKSPKELHSLLSSAERCLKQGVEEIQEGLKLDSQPTDDLIAAKIALAQILINQGKYDDAIARLAASPFSVEAAVTVAKGEKRPAAGITSRKTAALTYQLLLRAHVGTRRLPEAQRTLAQLESLGGGVNVSVSAIYLQLGKELQSEMKRLHVAGDKERVTEVLKSFGELLSAIEGSDTQSYSSLIWVAETYVALGEGIGDDKKTAHTYFVKGVTAYERIIDRASKDEAFLAADRINGVRLRLVNSFRLAGDFEKGLAEAGRILTRRPRALDAQVAAALLLDAWAISDEAKSGARYLEAINGRTVGNSRIQVWGWSGLASRLQSALERDSNNADYRARHLTARYNVVRCRRLYALAQKSKSTRQFELEKARRGIEVITALHADMSDQWWSRFDELFQNVLKDMGRQPLKLKRPGR